MKLIAALLFWLAGIVAVAFGPDPFETDTVFTIWIYITIEAGIILAILRPASYRHSYGRATLALLASVGFLAVGIVMGGHGGAQEPHIGAGIYWLFATSCAVFLLFMYSVIGAVRSRLKSG